MSERRKYQRERIGVLTNFYIVGGKFGKVEFSGLIVNICESGLLIEVSDKKYIEIAKTAQIGSEIRFSGIDEYEIFKERKIEYLEGTAKVVWTKDNDRVYLMGCEIENLPRKLEKYISDRKVIGFQRRGCVL